MAYIGVPPADRTSGARVRDEFTADGTQVCFQLSQEVPGSFESNIIAVVENVIQEPVSAYTIVDTITVALTSISGTFTKNETITGGTSAATGRVILVNAGSVVIRVITGTFQAAEGITGGSSSATATISTLTTNIGRGLNFSGTPTTGTKIYALHQNSATYQLKPAAGSVTPETLSENLRTFTVDKFTATSAQTAFTLSTAPVSVKSILVFIDGVMQTETTHYTLSGVTLTIGASLTTGQQVSIVHLGFSTVSRTAFPDASITTAMIADGAITSDKIATGGVATIDMADGSVTSLKIANGGIATVDIADAAVTTAKIADANVTSGKLATDISITNLAYTGTLTGGTGVVNLGSGQVYKDASGNVGIGTNNPLANLDVNNATSGGLITAFRSTGVNGGYVLFQGSGATPTITGYIGAATRTNTSGTITNFGITAKTNLVFGTNDGTEQMRIDTAGRVTTPNQVAFRVSIGTNQSISTTSAVKIQYTVVDYNIGSHFDTTNYRFTAPIAGNYLFTVVFNPYGIASGNSVNLNSYVNGNSSISLVRHFSTNEGDVSYCGTFMLKLNANDYVEMFAYSTDTGYGLSNGLFWNTFSGYLLG
jgi:hypothetical protein